MLPLVLFIIIIALIFDFINGFHDAANSIATVVSTRVLTPRFAVAWAAFFNFVAAFGFGTNVAKTLGTGMIVLDVKQDKLGDKNRVYFRPTPQGKTLQWSCQTDFEVQYTLRECR